MEIYFRDLSTQLFSQLQANEVLLINYEEEKSDFSRFNHNRIRQSGYVHQQHLTLDLINNKRQCSASFNLSGELESDLSQAQSLLNNLRSQRDYLPEDPYIHYATAINNSSFYGENYLPSTEETIIEIIETAKGLDLVGILASGEISQGFANSLGQFNWHTDYSFNFDWSIYQNSDKAIKQNYAGKQWNAETFQEKISFAQQTLPILSLEPKTISPGKYRVFLSPSALYELFELLNWGGFGLKSHRTAQTPLIKMIKDGVTLSDKISLTENHKTGLTPDFTQQGFKKPNEIKLIRNGRYKDCLNNHRSAKEYGESVNCNIEHPQSLAMNAGSLLQNQILNTLDTGVYISNLWYCNYSDRNNCRITGMTRFACLWVENGKPVASLGVMRFDESIYHILGDNLIALTKDREEILSSSTYEKRSEASAQLPGALVENFTFTL